MDFSKPISKDRRRHLGWRSDSQLTRTGPTHSDSRKTELTSLSQRLVNQDLNRRVFVAVAIMLRQSVYSRLAGYEDLNDAVFEYPCRSDLSLDQVRRSPRIAEQP